MPGIHDNAKAISSVGITDKSNPVFGQTAHRGKSYCGETGGKPSVPEKKKKDILPIELVE